MGVSDILIEWYLENKRDLPWRNTNSVYQIWLSEIILQQTRVAQGLSYYLAFTERFPEVQDLANASEDEVLKLWQGLGYYSRARNLHAAAKYVAHEMQGKFPESFLELKKMKGVGDYTAAAIASFCYREPIAVVDGNVYRVLSRYFDVAYPIDSSVGKKYFQELANATLNPEKPDLHNQAMMEFGALLCTPNPDCENCPLQNSCLSFANGSVKQRPVKSKKIKQITRYFNYLVLSDDEFCVLEKRGDKDIWQNLYQFPLIETSMEVSDPSEILGKVSFQEILGVSQQYKHVLSHQIIYAKFWEIKCLDLSCENGMVIKWQNIQDFAVSRLIENYLKNRG